MLEESENSSEDKLMTFWEHTEELAGRLKVVLYVLISSTIIMMVLPGDLSFLENPLELYRPLISVILRLMREEVLPANVKLIGLELTAPIELYLIASFIFGLAVTIPVIVYQVYRFVEPALYPDEKRSVYPFLASFSVLFVAGLLFGYRVLTPYLIWAMFPFFSAVGAEMIISLMDFYILLFITTLLNGLFFTFPVFFVLLVKHEVVSTELLTDNRRYFYAALFILTCIITPDGGHIGNFILFAPLVLLAESGILFAKRYEKKGTARRFWLTQGSSCKFCGETIPANETFCPSCGKSHR